MFSEQNPAWSEEDEKCCSIVIAEFSKCAGKSVSKDEWMRCNDWLNSLRPQSHWKPSDEQIKAIKWVIDGDSPENWNITLKNLYQDLKKLKG